MFKIMQQTFFERFTLTFFLATTLSDQLGGGLATIYFNHHERMKSEQKIKIKKHA